MKKFLLLSILSSQVLAQNSFTIRSERIVLPGEAATSAISSFTQDDQAQGASLLGNLELFTPGFATSSNGTFGASQSVFLRGTARGFSQTYFDGLQLRDASDIDQSFQAQLLPSSFVGSGEVMRGIQSGLYGADAVGGVINLTPSERASFIEARAGSYDQFDLAGGAKLSKTKFLIDYSSAKGPSAFNRHKTSFAEKDPYHSLSGYMAHHESYKKHRFYVKALFLEHEQEIDGGYPFGDLHNNDKSAQSHRIVATGVEKKKGGPLTYKLQLQHTDIEREILDTTYQGKSENINLEMGYLFSRYVNTLFFADFLHDKADIENEFSNKTIDNGSIGISAHENFGDAFFSQTARVDHHSRFGTKATYRLAIGYHLSKRLTMRASYATGFKAPTLYQLYTKLGGNSALSPTDAKGYDLGLHYKLLNSQLELNYFKTNLESQIDYDLQRSAYFNIAKSSLRGVELSYTQSFASRWSTKINATRLWSENVLTGERLLSRPDLTLALQLRFAASKKHQFSLLGYYKGERDDLTGVLPYYFTLGLTGDHQIAQDLKSYWLIRNILNRHYEDVRDYGTYERSLVIGIRKSL